MVFFFLFFSWSYIHQGAGRKVHKPILPAFLSSNLLSRSYHVIDLLATANLFFFTHIELISIDPPTTFKTQHKHNPSKSSYQSHIPPQWQQYLKTSPRPADAPPHLRVAQTSPTAAVALVHPLHLYSFTIEPKADDYPYRQHRQHSLRSRPRKPRNAHPEKRSLYHW